jgi:hypothetical protein
MGWFSKIIGGGFGTLVEQVGGVVDKFHLSREEKQKFKLELESLLQKRESEMESTLRSELQAKERILVAELQQGDSYTKRARPTVVYVGLGFIFFNYCLVPLIAHLFGNQQVALQMDLPGEFWVGWSGIVATWSVGRTFEKRGSHNRWTRAITGSRSISGMLDDEIVKG